MWCIVYCQKCGVTIRFVTVCLLGYVVYCLLPKMWSYHQVCYCVSIRKCSALFITKNAELPLGLLLCVYQEMQCIVYYQKCGVTIRFVTVCLLGNVVQCLLPIIIRFVTVCLLGYVVYCLLPKMRSYHQVCYCVFIRKCSTVFITTNHQVCYCMFIRICSVLFITKNAELPLGLLLCVYQEMQHSVYYH